MRIILIIGKVTKVMGKIVSMAAPIIKFIKEVKFKS